MFDCRKTVDDMYKYSKSVDSCLLSTFGASNEGFSFWDEYRAKYKRYDKLFNRMFNSFKYFMQEKGQTIEEITEEFIDDVYNHLMVNAKKYEELYRINVINDEDYSITDNYNITETMEKEIAKEDSNILGEREDSNSRIYGQKETEVESSYGQTQTTTNYTKGQQSDSQTDDIAGFNSSTYAKDTTRSNTYGSRQDSSTETTPLHSDTETTTEGQQTVGDTFTKGEQTDTFTGSQTEDYTLTRKGNIGVRTITEVLEYHEQFWTVYEFYTLIFKEICAELLLI